MTGVINNMDFQAKLKFAFPFEEVLTSLLKPFKHNAVTMIIGKRAIWLAT